MPKVREINTDRSEILKHLRQTTESLIITDEHVNSFVNSAEALDRYVNERIGTGSFLRSVLENNLHRSLGKADRFNRDLIYPLVSFIHWNLPSSCWGSPGIVEKWLENGE